MKRLRTAGLFAAVVLFADRPALAAQDLFTIDGYGEFLYQRFDYGPNQNLPNGSEPDSRAATDIRRFNLGFESRFTDDLTFSLEVEFEHGGTGSALELEYEEFGEFEFEVEKGGEVQLERIHLTRHFSPAFNVRLGEILVPVGLTNSYHVPTEYLGTMRPESESNIIPLTWHETGVAAFGVVRGVRYRVQVVNGLDATGFSSRNWIVEGKQQKFESSIATDLGFAARLEASPMTGLTVGVSGYRGNSTGNRPKNDMEGIDGKVTIGAAHALFRSGPLVARAGVLHGRLQNSALISARNAGLSRNIQSPRTPVGSAALGWSVEAGVDVGPWLDPEGGTRLVPFARYERYDPMHDTADAVFDVPRFETAVATVGISWFWTSGVAFKADYSMREVGRGAFNDENTFTLALAFAETLFTQ
ncbi:MAG: hypothetical protein AAF389_17365 [Gemmatimonadota bacterium]